MNSLFPVLANLQFISSCYFNKALTCNYFTIDLHLKCEYASF